MRKKSVLRTPALPSCGQAHKQCSHAGTPSSLQPSSLPACLPLRHNELLSCLPITDLPWASTAGAPGSPAPVPPPNSHFSWPAPLAHTLLPTSTGT